MSVPFLDSFQSEWMKTKRSLAFWMVIIGAFFTPAVIVIARLARYSRLPGVYLADNFWNLHWRNCWESMAIFLLPLGAILTTSLIAQLEYKNNTWKQLHTLPLSYATIFFSKLAVILVLMLLFFVLFNIGIYLSALAPYLLSSGAPWPRQPIPLGRFLRDGALFYVDTLPIVALQYLIALRFRNFLVPVGLGFVFWVGALAALPWNYGYVIPYTYPMLNYLSSGVETKAVIPDVNIHYMAVAYFAVITAASFALYATNKEKG